MTHVRFSHRPAEESYPTALAWPGPGGTWHELADDVAQALTEAGPDPVLDPLRERIAEWNADPESDSDLDE